MKKPLAALLPFAAALLLCDGAYAHAAVSPPVVPAGASQMFTLAVPTEKEGATTTKIELTPPAGFNIDSFAATAGWKRETDQTGSGEEVVIRKASWSGGDVPTGEDAVFQFLAEPTDAKTYAFKVRQTYSDGSVVDWTGAEDSDTPAPTIEARGSLGSGGGSTLALIALVLGALGLLAGLAALGRAGGRELA